MRRATPEEARLLYAAIRRWRGSRIPNGRVRASPSRFDPDQLAIGIGVEMEHTKRPEVAMEIAMAHLLERADYYARLERYVERHHR